VSQSIPFSEKLQEKIGDILKNAGFAITFEYAQPIEELAYERQSESFNGVDRINFHGSEDYPNCIYANAVSASGGLAFIPVLRGLADHFEGLRFPDNQRWSYHNEDTLDQVANEIAMIIRDKLLEWFENPSSPTLL
jgi:hypothetical protein